jgi:indolepyruvate ferredoxin oxidoreductase
VAASGYRLIDRYVHDQGRVFMSGSQALARLPFEQLRADRAAGLNTAAFVSGYPGSPLAAFDRDAAAAGQLANEAGYTMVVQPGLNEELAATSVMGSQLATTVESCRFDGIIGIWFGKAPGLDRASDAIRHAVFAGASANGGAVALVGDDPRAKSSTLPSSSDATLVDLHMPVLYPGDVQEAIDLGRHAIALSRASGLWTSIKVVDAVADGTGTVDITLDRVRPVMTRFEVNGTQFVPRPSGKLLTPYTLDLEREFQEVRLEIARIYGAENRLNAISVRGPHDWIGLVAAGHTHHEMVESLRLLGFESDDDLRGAGIRILKLGLPIPHDPRIVREFAGGLTEVMVIEEKNPTLELLVKDALYSMNERPVVTGKQNPDGTALLPRIGTLDADTITPRLRARLAQRLAQRMTPPPPPPRQMIPLSVNRSPYFCSGCPHNTSTKVDDGELIGAGIGCHSMVMLMEPERVGSIVGLTAMGNEGAQWIGIAPFVAETHLTQNLGDGTLFHSGILAVRAAAASGVNITFKVLYNDAVAMTGGQHPNGQLDVPHLVQALLAEGASQVMITTDDPRRYDDIPLPDGVKVWGRKRVVEAQRLLATQPGCTVLIHDQRCAAEKRRDRKRGRIARPAFKVLINERVCEGCGDCGEVSNCLSVQAVETPFGRKTRIDQNSCNFDLACMEGDCPSFAAVSPSKRSKRATRHTGTGIPAERPQPPKVAPAPVAGTPHTIRMSGIGGTGVVTISQILGTAAMIDGLQVRGLDQTGLSQKAGTVVSDLRITAARPQPSNKATAGSVDLLLAFDQLAASSDAQLVGAAARRTRAVVNSARVPTGSMVAHPEQPFPTAEIDRRLAEFTASRRDVDATGLTIALLGDDSGANVFLLGVACQLGELPAAAAAIEQAIELNGVAVAKNLAAFAWGRAWVHDPASVEGAAGVRPSEPDGDQPLAQRLAADLRDYQSDRYADRFQRVVDGVAAVGHPELTDAVARHLHKLMAYKDEYEVARLLLLPESQAAAEAVAGPGATVRWKLHPPVLRTLGLHRKLTLGRWARPIMVVLRAMRGVRGTPLDVFGWAKVRRVEKAMIPEYIAAIEVMLPGVNADNLAEAVAIASLPDQVRGYEHLKMERAGLYRAELSRRVQIFCDRTLSTAP